MMITFPVLGLSIKLILGMFLPLSAKARCVFLSSDFDKDATTKIYLYMLQIEKKVSIFEN